MAKVTMREDDVLSASLAEAYVTIGSNRYKFIQMKEFEAKFEKTKVEVPILGQTGVGHKATGWKGTFSATMYFNQSLLREIFMKYQETGEDTYFDIQITNEDPTSKVGRQTIVFLNCNLDDGILAKLEAGGEVLEEECSGTFSAVKMPESFKLLNGMV